MTSPDNLSALQRRFNDAMARYDGRPAYKRIGLAVSITNVGLQGLLLYQAIPMPLAWTGRLGALLLSIVLADFLNGLVHLWMDNNARYGPPFGPLVAAFHLHHRTPAYIPRPLPRVYFHESGSKIWLIPFLALSFVFIAAGGASPFTAHVLAFTGILSSVAEVSHYCCHVPDTTISKALRGTGLFLSKSRHAHHHREDNRSYTFLNGVTDPLVDRIAAVFFQGYKTTTDLHYALYQGPDTSNRETKP